GQEVSGRSAGGHSRVGPRRAADLATALTPPNLRVSIQQDGAPYARRSGSSPVVAGSSPAETSDSVCSGAPAPLSRLWWPHDSPQLVHHLLVVSGLRLSPRSR